MPTSPSKPFPFFDLPKELREKVYRELLCSAKVEEPVLDVAIQRRYKFHVAILGCSRQMHIEATPILYAENCLILLQLNWEPPTYGFPGIVWPPPRPTADTGPWGFLYQKVAVNLRVNRTVQSNRTWSIMATPFELLAIMHQLSIPDGRHQSEPRRWPMLRPGSLELSLDTNILHRHKEQTKVLIDGLLGLGGLTNIRTVNISGLGGRDTAALSSLIRSRGYSTDERLARASELISRGDRYLLSQTPNQDHLAYRCYYECTAFFQGFYYLRDDSNPGKIVALADICVWTNLAYASSLHHFGKEEQGRRWHEAWAPHLRNCLADTVAKYYFLLSRTLMRASSELQALYPLWWALRTRPGWPVTLALADELDQRMQREPLLKSRIATPFEVLVGPLRNQPPRPMTIDGYDGSATASVEEYRAARIITEWPTKCNLLSSPACFSRNPAGDSGS
ncbi:MAG: hypothetical protein LQ341_005162 [Variospora aurantia]|nr:MAG: hypothetical protein LQ341_005162 [Variospora aurantia]